MFQQQKNITIQHYKLYLYCRFLIFLDQLLLLRKEKIEANKSNKINSLKFT
jgi:hypothetical protein